MPIEAAESLRGSRESRIRQNQEANRMKLSRIKDDKHLANMKKLGLLVALPENENLQIDSRLPEEFRFCRPWVKTFLLTMGRDFRKKFPSGGIIQVNSAVRTMVYQEELRRKNRNAVSSKGRLASSHTTGATVDIAKLNLSSEEIKWLEAYLLRLKKARRVEAIEERRQQVFHVMVLK